MEQGIVAQLVEENLKIIFAYALSKLHNREEAEDLAGDIVMEILKCGHRVNNEKAFYGYMWSIAKNTYKKFLRSKKYEVVEFQEDFLGAYFESGYANMEIQEDVMCLRRELSLLSSQYRQATVLYYIDNKTCSEIATEMNISLEMVKYYLFKTRKILKEGIGMTRTLGEKSYNPGVFYMDYWGIGGNSEFCALFKRRLPGNILLAAYEHALTMTELSVELGVATPYLEEEVDILVEHDLLKQMSNGRYQTNIIIFKEIYGVEVEKRVRPIVKDKLKDIEECLKQLQDKAREVAFKDKAYTNNQVLWALATLAMHYGVCITDENIGHKYGEYPLLANGSHGFVFGHDTQYACHQLNGVYVNSQNEEQTAYFSAFNYKVIGKSQWWNPIKWHETTQVMTAAILGEEAQEDNEILIKMIEKQFIKCIDKKMSVNFPVYTTQEFEGLWQLVEPVGIKISTVLDEVCKLAGELLKDYVPKSLIEYCEHLAAIRYHVDTVGLIVEILVEDGLLTLPTPTQKVGMYGVTCINEEEEAN